MSVGILPPPAIEEAISLPLYRFSVEQYHRMGEIGLLTPEHRVEFLEGLVVNKMNVNPPHGNAMELVDDEIRRVLPKNWRVRSQLPVTTLDSEPEPDFAIVLTGPRDRKGRHPNPDEVGLVVEVADSSLARDRGPKARLYARAEVPTYWIVNLIDRQVEVYTDPTGPCDEPKYATLTNYVAGSEVPVVLDGVEVARLKVDDLLP